MNKEYDYNKATKSSAFWFTALPFITQLARFINSLLLARLLSPEVFGIIGILSVLMIYSDTFSDFGFGKAIIQKKRVREVHFRSYFTFNLIVSVLLYLLLTLNSEDIATFFEVKELALAIDVFGIYILITAFLTPIKVKLSREINYKTIAIVDAIRFAIQIPISLSLAFNGFGFWSIICAMLAGQVLALIIFVRINKGFILFSRKLYLLKGMFGFSKWDFVTGQAKLLSENIDKLFLAKFLGVSDVGLYDRAQGIAIMPYTQISQNLSSVSFSSFSRFQNSENELKYYFGRLMSFQTLLIFPMLLGLASVSEVFVSSLLGVKWFEMIPTLKLISFAYLIGALASPFSSLNSATGSIAIQTKLSLIFLIFLIIALYFFTPYGINAVAACLIGFQLLRLIGYAIISKINSNISFRFVSMQLLPYLISGLLMYSSVRFVYYLNITVTDWVYLILLIFTGAMVYSIAILIMPFESSKFVKVKAKNAILSITRKL